MLLSALFKKNIIAQIKSDCAQDLHKFCDKYDNSTNKMLYSINKNNLSKLWCLQLTAKSDVKILDIKVSNW